jgi:hypothetical protein
MREQSGGPGHCLVRGGFSPGGKDAAAFIGSDVALPTADLLDPHGESADVHSFADELRVRLIPPATTRIRTGSWPSPFVSASK